MSHYILRGKNVESKGGWLVMEVSFLTLEFGPAKKRISLMEQSLYKRNSHAIYI